LRANLIEKERTSERKKRSLLEKEYAAKKKDIKKYIPTNLS